MEFQTAFAMADELSMPVVDVGAFHFGHDPLFAGLGFDFPAPAVSSSKHAVPAKSEPLPFSIFGGSMQSSSANPQPNGSGLIDSDEDYGDFESVPAEVFRAHPPSNVASSKVEATNFTLQRQESYDLFDFLRPSSNAQSGPARTSIAPDDLFGNLSAATEKPCVPSSKISDDLLGTPPATTGDALYPADKMADAVGAPRATAPESKSHDDDDDLFGEFSSTTADKMADATGAPSATAPESKSNDDDDLFGDFSSTTAKSLFPADKSRSGAIHTSIASDDLFANVSTTAENPLFPSDKFTGASGKLHGTLLESNSDDDWGDFVEHSNSVTQEVLQTFDWFDTTSRPADVASPVTPRTNGANSGWMYQQSTNLAGNQASEVSPDVFSAFAPLSNFTVKARADLSSEDANLVDIHSLDAEPVEYRNFDIGHFDGYGNPVAGGNKGFTRETLEKLNAHGLNNSANGPTDQLHVPSLQRSSSTILTRKVSIIENSSTPIPLSLFGEEDSENEKPREEVEDMVPRPFQGHSRSKSLSSGPLPSGIGNFSDFISSLYVKSPLDMDATNALKSSNGSLEGHEGSEIPAAEKHTIRFSSDDTVDEDGLFNNAAINAHQNVKYSESSSLEEQLFGLKVDVPNIKADFEVADGGFREIPTILKEDSMLSGIEPDPPYDGSSLEEQFFGLKVDVGNAKLNFGVADREVCEMATSFKEDSMYTGDGRVISGGAHAVVLDQLSFFQEMDASEQEIATSLEREMKARSDVTAAMDLHSQAVTIFPAWACPSVEGQHLFVKAWADVLTVCASELEHALDVWRQAQLADVHLVLLANLQGKQYFAAVGQIYAVCLIFAAALTLYRPWLAVAVKEGQNAQASLERCKRAWVGTGLEETVRLALSGLGSLLPSSALSWKDIEGCATIAHRAAMQAASSVTTHEPFQPLCGLSLLPLPLFSCSRSVEWAGRHYLLPVANIWANCVSNEAPKLPSIVLGKIGTW